MKKEIYKDCRKHGETIYSLRSDNTYRCRKCASERVSRWRRRTKEKAVKYKGGKCIKCGYNKYVGALVFHHIEDNKAFGIGNKGKTRAWEKLIKELDKCELLCLNCHSETHAGVAQ